MDIYNIKEKLCSKCIKSKILTEFYKDKYSKDGYCSACKECHLIYKKENAEKIKINSKNHREKHKELINQKSREYYKNNPEKFKEKRTINKVKNIEYQKKYRIENAESIKEKKKIYYLNNKEYVKKYNQKNREYIAERVKLYRQQNHDKIREDGRAYDKKRAVKKSIYLKSYQKLKYNTDPIFKLRVNIRNLIREKLKNTNSTKQNKTIEILGCDILTFKNYIESKFKDGMTWDNRSEWHLDHIIPISFGITSSEIILLNHYTNFQPLWIFENLSKSASINDAAKQHPIMVEILKNRNK